jgi:hypothetical protein
MGRSVPMLRDTRKPTLGPPGSRAVRRARLADAIASWVLVLDGLALLALIGKVILEGRWTHLECESVESHVLGGLVQGAEWMLLAALVGGIGALVLRTRRKLRAAGAVALTIPIFLVAAVVGMFGCY